MNSSATDTASTAPVMPMADSSPHPRFNALKHGILSRYTVLSHENHSDYESLVNSRVKDVKSQLKSATFQAKRKHHETQHSCGLASDSFG
jgi:hypothetical protein